MGMYVSMSGKGQNVVGGPRSGTHCQGLAALTRLVLFTMAADEKSNNRKLNFTNSI